MAYVQVGVRCLLALVFLASAGGKLRGRRAYAGFVVATARLLPARVSRPALPRMVAAGALGMEIALPVALAVPVTAPLALVLAGLLLSTFGLAIAAALRRGQRTSCHCFGASTAPLGPVAVYRDLLLLAAAGLGVVAGRAGGGAPGLPGVALALVAGATLAAVAVCADDIAALVRPVR